MFSGWLPGAALSAWTTGVSVPLALTRNELTVPLAPSSGLETKRKLPSGVIADPKGFAWLASVPEPIAWRNETAPLAATFQATTTSGAEAGLLFSLGE